MPQIGSTASAGASAADAAAMGGSRSSRRSARRMETIAARIESAISFGVREPMSMPAGTSIRASACSGDAVMPQLLQHPGAAALARNEADVGHAYLERAPQHVQLV